MATLREQAATAGATGDALQHRELFGWSRFLGLAGGVAVLW
jgi:hypothetical protein